jgi:hypothetical protein
MESSNTSFAVVYATHRTHDNTQMLVGMGGFGCQSNVSALRRGRFDLFGRTFENKNCQNTQKIYIFFREKADFKVHLA